MLVVSSVGAGGCDAWSGLTAMGYHVEITRSARDAVRRATAQVFDAYVVDRDFLRGAGRRLVARLRTRGVSAPLLALTRVGTVEERVAMLEAGADDSLAGPVASEELAALVRANLRWRSRAVGGQVVRVGPLALDIGRRGATLEGSDGRAALRLRRKEFSMLHALAQDAGAVVTRAALADRVWGEGVHVSRNTFDVTVCGLRQQLRAAACSVCATYAPWVDTVRGKGYRLMSVDQRGC